MICRRITFACATVLLVAGNVLAQTQISINNAPSNLTTTVTAAASIVVAVSAGPGNTTDWIGLYPAGAADGAYIDWRYLNGTTVPPAIGMADASFTVNAPVMPGEYEFRLFENNGYDRLATSGNVAVLSSSAHIAVNGTVPPAAVSIAAGGHVVATITNGPGNAGDWVGLFTVAAPDDAYVSWKYLNGTTAAPSTGSASATVTFAVPTTPGSYELRFFATNGDARLATSTTIVVQASSAQVAVNSMVPPEGVNVDAGSVTVVSVSSGPGNTGDWVGLYPIGGVDTAYVDWRYLNDTAAMPSDPVNAATLHFGTPTAAGSFEFRFMADNGYSRLATSSTVTVAAPAAQITVNDAAPAEPVSVQPGDTVTVHVSGAPGNTTDWVALAAIGSVDTSYEGWQYLSGTTAPASPALGDATLRFTLPVSAGIYEVRLFANNGFGRLATSGAVRALTAAAGCAFVVNPVALTAAAAGASGQIAVTTGSGCGWTTSSDASWATASAGTDGSGSATYAIAPNTTRTARTAALTVAGHAITIAQEGIAVPTVTVVVTSPFPGTTFNSPSSIALSASTTVGNGTISRVDFFAGSTLVGSASGSPYQVAWSSPAPGVYALRAVAIDNVGGVTTSLPAHITVTDFNVDLGTLAAPMATPTGSIIGPTQLVTLAAASGVTIRYTLDGTTPTGNSPLYTTPISLVSSATIMARAFEGGWTASDVMVGAYQIDSTGPVITASVSPLPNSSGWNTTVTTVTFTCSDDLAGVGVCPGPVVFDQQGFAQEISVVAIDNAGNQTTKVQLVNVDLAAPVIAVNSQPETTTAHELTVTGSVADAPSGVAYTACNGVPAASAGGAFQCTVPLYLGTNTIVMTSSDVSGNNASVAVRVRRLSDGPPTVFMITPTSGTLMVGQVRELRAVTESGIVSTGVTWSSSDENIVSVLGEDKVTVSGVGSGSAIITASMDGMSAQATIKVKNVIVETGSTIWSVSPTPDLTTQPPIYASRVDSDAPDLFVVESDANNEVTTVRGLREDGVQLSTEVLAGSPLFGDVFGGLIAVTGLDADVGNIPTSLTRFGGGADAPSWRYETSGYLFAGPSFGRTDMAQSADGTIILKEFGKDYGFRGVVTLNGASGQVKHRYTTPMTTSTILGDCPVSVVGEGVTHPAEPMFPVYGSDGTAYMVVLEEHFVTTLHCVPDSTYIDFSQTLFNYTQTLQLMTIPANGEPTFTPLREPAIVSNAGGEYLSVVGLAPDDRGGALVSWIRGHFNPEVSPGIGVGADIYESMVTRLSAQSAAEHVIRSMDPNACDSKCFESPLALVTGNDAVYLKYGSTVERRNRVSWALDWSDTTGAAPKASTADDTVMLHGPAGIVEKDATGTVVQSSALDIADPVSLSEPGQWYGLDPLRDSVVAKAGPNYLDEVHSFVGQRGNVSGRGASSLPLLVHILTVEPFSPGYGLSQFQVNVSTKAAYYDLSFVPKSKADSRTVLEAFNNRKAWAVAYIGHSVTHPITNQSVGLRTPGSTPPFDSSIVKRAEDEASQVHTDPPPYSRTTIVDSIPTKARLVFIGSCNTNAEFQSLFGIRDVPTEKRALVVSKPRNPPPPEGDTDLRAAATAWDTIIRELATGVNTLEEAVIEANRQLDLTFLAVQGEHLQFKVIGNHELTLK